MPQAEVKHVFAEFSLSNTPYIEDIDRPPEQEPCAPINSLELQLLGVLSECYCFLNNASFIEKQLFDP